jgi:hypothetical protein
MPKVYKALLVSGAAAMAAIVLLTLYYAVLPVLSPYRSVEIPASCNAVAPAPGPDLSAAVRYAIPDAGNGILVARDARSAVVVMADYSRPPFSSAVFLVRTGSGRVVRRLRFDNDIVTAAIDGGVLYVFNDKRGYIIDASTGRFSNNLVETDNYRGVYTDGNRRYLQTSADISFLRLDGPPVSHLQLSFRGTAFGCYFG